MEEGEKRTLTIPEAVMLGLLSGFAYLYVYLIERGFYTYFKMPLFLIRISLEQFLANSLFFFYVTGIVMLMFWYFSLFSLPRFLKSNNFPHVTEDYYRGAIKIFVLSILVFAVIFRYLVDYYNLLAPDSRFTLIFVWLVGLSLILFLAIPYSLNRYRQNREDKTQVKSRPRLLVSFFGNGLDLKAVDLFIFTCFLVSLLFFAYIRGYREAKEDTEYYVTNTTPELVVLRNNGNELICAAFDREAKVVLPVFSVLNIVGERGLTISFEELGELRPVKPGK